jgi:hypothetical protein
VNLTNVGVPFHGRLVASFDGYAEKFQQTLSMEDGEAQTVAIDPSFTDSIKSLRAATPATFRLDIYDDLDRTVYSDTKALKLLPLSYFAWYVNGELTHFLSPVFVTPNSDFVADVLKDAAGRTPWGGIVGYQYVSGYSHDEVTQYQMAAVWDALQERGFTYVNAPEAYSTSTVQNIKSAADTYADGSGNCIESVILLASVLEATGMTVNLVFTLGHAFLGVDTWYDDPTVNPIETTMLPSDTFDDAFQAGINRYERDRNSPFFHVIDVNVARDNGILPNPWIT